MSGLIVAVVGPSHGGKTTLIRHLEEQPDSYCLRTAPPLLDVDQILGSSNRSDSAKAAGVIRCAAREIGDVLVDVGAGQLVQEPFRQFLRSSAVVMIAVWCDEATFRSRHSAATADREVLNNYSPVTQEVWDSCRAAGRLVNTSYPISTDQSASALGKVVAAIVPQWSAA